MSACTLLLLILVSYCTADTPANCSYEDIGGTWMVNIDNAGQTNKVNCSDPVQVTTSFKIHLLFPDVAVDEDGNRGFWTLIYNQGFEFVINGRKYFAFSMYKKEGTTVTSLCDRTFNGWVHDVIKDLKFPPQNWGCYYATKIPTELGQVSKLNTYQLRDQQELSLLDMPYKQNEAFINQINKVQSSWKAASYKEYEGLTIKQMLKRSGWSQNSFPLPKVKPHPPSREVLEAAAKLPLQFDWRDVNGINYVSPVRNQGSCGSCYAFASMGMLEARFRIKSNNTIKPIFSTQNIVSCSNYSQGCDGGFPYLVAGKYTEDFGDIEEQCYPYSPTSKGCHPLIPHCKRYFATNYKYIGGFYGACSEPEMRLDLVRNGPIAVNMEVYTDLQFYTSGVYCHTGLTDKFNPWEITNHVVVIVGYGQLGNSGEKFWIVKNSWGSSWGEKGYFRIIRGVDNCSIESMAVGTIPVLHPRSE